jgi:superfamily II DNA helicase RecQ
MQFRTFTVPADDPAGAEQELNRFLRAHRVLDTVVHLVPDGAHSRWCFCVKYLETPAAGPDGARREARVDYKQVLDAKTFAVFARLREVRKEFAQEDGVPAFAIFTDEQLAGMAKLEHLDAQTLKTIPGIGEGKVERYAARFLGALQRGTAHDAPDGQPV